MCNALVVVIVCDFFVPTGSLLNQRGIKKYFSFRNSVVQCSKALMASFYISICCAHLFEAPYGKVIRKHHCFLASLSESFFNTVFT